MKKSLLLLILFKGLIFFAALAQTATSSTAGKATFSNPLNVPVI
jgi:hypothetical protein